MWIALLSAALAGPTVPITTDPVRIDGVLSEPDWQRAVPITDFKRYLPSAGGPPAGRTEVRFLQDERNLYIAISVTGLDYVPRARISPREDINDDDQVGVYLDTVGDGRTGYILYFNPLGIQQDIRYSGGDWFVDWDAIFTSEGVVTEDGYTIEVALPFRSLRYPDPDGTPQTWGVMITRKVPHENAKYAWPELKRNHPRLFLQAAPLPGIVPASRGAGLQVQPVLALRHQRTADEDGQLAWTGLEPLNESIRPGLDLRLGITPDIGAAFTLNPDFSQIEGDVSIINLNQRFAFYYPEQRPFFLDNIDAFEDQNDTLYTRSVVAPLYGVKIAGQEGPASVGLLQAIDTAPSASIHEDGTPGFSEEDVDGRWAEDAFARLRLDAFGAGYVGLTVADKRILGSSGGFSDVLAADLSAPLGEVWTAEASAAGSIAGDDTESLTGGAGDVGVWRSPELGTGGGVSLSGSSAGYRQELGYLTQSGVGTGNLWINHTMARDSLVWTPALSLYVGAEAADQQYAQLAHSQSITLGVHSASLFAAAQRWDWSAVVVDGWKLRGSWRANLSKVLSLTAAVQRGQELDYDLLVPAMSTVGIVGGTVRPTLGTRLDVDVVQQWFTPQASDTESASRIYTRFNWQFLKPLGLRLIQQTNLSSEADDPDISASALLTWTEHPGSEVYLGATWAAAGSALTEQVVFAKITHVFQL